MEVTIWWNLLVENFGGNVTFDILTSFASIASFTSFANFALFAFLSWSFITIPTMFGDWIIYCLHFLAPYVGHHILGRKRVDAGGAIQLAGKTLTVEISDLLKGGFPNFGFDQM